MNSGVDCLLESNESLRGASAALSDLIEEAPCIAHLKDAQTGKYIYSNDHWIEKLGLKSAKDIYGLTVDDLTGTDGVYTKWNFGHSFLYYREELSKEIHRLESQVQMLFAMSPDFDFSGVDNPDIQKLQDKVETASWHELVTRLRARPSAFFSEIATGASR